MVPSATKRPLEPDPRPEVQIDARSPMCLSVLNQIRAFEAIHRVPAGWFAASWMAYNAMLREMEKLTGTSPKGISIDGAAIIVYEMCPQYARTTEPLH